MSWVKNVKVEMNLFQKISESLQVETDGETQIGTEEEEEEELLGGDEPRDVDIEVDTVSLEAQYENMLEGKTIKTFFFDRADF